ncbi:probable proline--tRNA ligase, mitochondrial isoform X2 [Hetaerina americana]|uniref:probable proline--tRNA ligase, mitochondrial isoform X2 n=1 Tax=Hetaerina americana TaxID=62018 RepID=UPI003A7F35B5
MARKIERISTLFQPLKVIPKNATLKGDNLLSNSQKLMLENGIIRQSGNGMFHILPLGMKALEKLIKLVDKEMAKLNAQKVLLPALTDAKLWIKSGRWQTAGAELFKMKDRHSKEYILSPTHEEAIAALVASISPVSHHKLPIRMYQISSKFRDEKKSRFGMIRGKEFIMKDLYTFDQTLPAAKNTYAEVCQAYDKIFGAIGVSYAKVIGDNGIMGGSLSHEYHFLTKIGEDSLMLCDTCKYGANKEVFEGENCPSCKNGKIQEKHGIEVGHTFVLGSSYSAPLDATFMDSDGKANPLEMGSYGLGMTRILAAAIESLSPADEIRWPLVLTPYTVCIITPKDGSKEEAASQTAYKLYNDLNSINSLRGDVIIDDRGSLTIE